MRRMRNGTLIGLAALAAASLAAGCRNDTTAGPQRAEDRGPARSVRVVLASLGALPRTITVSGTLAAEEQVVLGMKVTGRLAELEVDLGSRARKGEPLARLVSTDFTLRVAQADAALQQARSRLGLSAGAPDEAVVDIEQTPLVRQARAVLNESRLAYERAQRLYEEELISRADLDAAQAALEVADGRHQDAIEEILTRQALLAQRRTELELARQQLRDSVLTAPFDGAVRERHATPGEYVAAGQPILTLVRVDPLRLKLAVPERESAGLKVGQDVRLTIEGDETAYAGRVARLSPAIEETNRTLMVEAEVPNPEGRLRPGAFATASVVTSAERPVVFVPVSSIVTFAGIEKVLVVEDGLSVEKRVRTGRRSGDRVEVLEGLRAGEQVVIEPGNLTGGESVAVAG